MFKSILVPVNLEDAQTVNSAMETAIKLAQQGGAKLHFLTVFPGFGMPLVGSFFPEGAEGEAMKQCSERLRQLVSDAVPAGIEVSTDVEEGNAWESILRYAEKRAVDLIVMPSRHRAQSLLGSVSARVAERAKCSVLITRV
ncbi:MAG: universal stress protein [Gammaproteobacteria bacterium]|nr:universal stress protein [Gammaproteobacteria bacterium]